MAFSGASARIRSGDCTPPEMRWLLGSFNEALRCFQWVGGIRSLPDSSRQPTPDFVFALNDIGAHPDQLLGEVRAGYIHSLPQAALGRIRPPNPSAKTISSVGPWGGVWFERVVDGAGYLRMPEASQPVAGRWSGSDTTGKLPPI